MNFFKIGIVILSLFILAGAGRVPLAQKSFSKDRVGLQKLLVHWAVFDDRYSQDLLFELSRKVHRAGVVVLIDAAPDSIRIEGQVYANDFQNSRETAFGNMGAQRAGNWSYWEANLSIKGSCPNNTDLDEHWVIRASGSRKYNTSRTLRNQLSHSLAQKLGELCESAGSN